MKLTTISEKDSGAQIGLSILVIGVSFLTFIVLSIVLTTGIFGISLRDLQDTNSIANPAYVNAFKFSQIILSIGIFVIPPLILGRLFSGNSFSYLNINRRPDVTQLLLAFSIAAFAIPVINLIAMLNTHIQFPEFMSGIEENFKSAEKNADTITLAFMKVTSISGLLVNLLMMAIVPAIGEELFFRGFLQKMITGWTKNHHWGIIITGFIFSAIHMQFYGFFPRWLLGILLGYMFVWSGNLWLPVMAHFVNNALAVGGYYLANMHVISDKSTEIGAGWDIKSLIITLVTTGIMTLSIYTFYTYKNVKVNTN